MVVSAADRFFAVSGAGGMAVYAKKSEIIDKETSNCAVLGDCVPVITNLIACDLDVDNALRQSVIRSLVQMVVSSETVVRKLRMVRETDARMTSLLRVMREHVMTQYKHYQLYTHHVVAVVECLARVVKRNKAKENEFIETTYAVGKDSCTMLDILLKPTQYLVNMNEMFDDLGGMLLDRQDTDHLGEIKRYLTQVFNKIQSKLDLLSQIIDEIGRQYEKKKSTDEKWKKIKGKLNKLFETTIVKPCSFTINLYLNYYFPDEEQMNEYLNSFS